MDGQQALLEAMRQRQGQVASGVGIPGGAAAMRQPSPNNPMAQSGMIPQQNVPAAGALPQPGNATNPSSGAVDAMQKAQPGEAQMIVKALIDRLKNHPVPPPGQ